MTAKTFEVRDRMTFIPVLAVRLDPGCEADRYILARAGYGRTPGGQGEYIQLLRLAGGEGASNCDPYGWADRTMQTAHVYILEKFDVLQSGEVVDVRYLLGEQPAPAPSEAD